MACTTFTRPLLTGSPWVGAWAGGLRPSGARRLAAAWARCRAAATAAASISWLSCCCSWLSWACSAAASASSLLTGGAGGLRGRLAGPLLLARSRFGRVQLLLLGAVLVDVVVDVAGRHLQVLGPHRRVGRSLGQRPGCRSPRPCSSGWPPGAAPTRLPDDLALELADLLLVGADLLAEGGHVEVGLLVGQGQLSGSGPRPPSTWASRAASWALVVPIWSAPARATGSATDAPMRTTATVMPTIVRFTTQATLRPAATPLLAAAWRCDPSGGRP